MAARIFSHDEVGAPQLSAANDGSLLGILRACLVDGFGSRTPAGWSMPFSDLPNNKAAFKPPNDNVYLRLDDNYSYQWAKIRGYTSMTDVDTGDGEFPRDIDLPTVSYFLTTSKRYSTIAGYEKWHVIAEENWFYFYVEYPGDTYPGGFFFGKIDHVDAASPAPYLICGYATTSSQTTTNFPHSLVGTGSWWMNDDYYLSGNPDQIQDTYDDTSYLNPNPITGKLELTQREIVTNTSPFVRYGRRPNLFAALGSNSIVYPGGQKITISTVKYIVIRYSTRLFLLKYDTDAG